MKSDILTEKLPLLLIATGMFLVGTGCKDQSIQVYQIPKEQPKAARAMAGGGASMPAAPKPHLHWGNLPANWTEAAPSSMRAASLTIQGEDGKTADVGAIPLPSMAGRELDFVNMWRGNMKLPETTTNEIAKIREDVTIAGEAGQLFDMVSDELLVDEKYKQRVVVGMFTRDDTTWFLKLTGPDDLVTAEKPNFLTWLETIEVDSGTHGQPAPQMSQVPPPASTASGDWNVPANWTAQPPGQMLLASFGLPGGDAKVTVSSLGGDGGGLLMNVNRWRRQLGLPPIDDSKLGESTSPIDTNDGKGTLVDIQGTGQRMLAVIVPHNGQSWFYKSMGAADIVDREREAFLTFAKTAKR